MLIVVCFWLDRKCCLLIPAGGGGYTASRFQCGHLDGVETFPRVPVDHLDFVNPLIVSANTLSEEAPELPTEE